MAKITTAVLLKMKQQADKISMLTAYDASFAKLFAEQGVDVLLIGDSLGMVLQGHSDTLPVTVADIAYHTKSVRARCIRDSRFTFYELRHARTSDAKCYATNAGGCQYGEVRRG